MPFNYLYWGIIALQCCGNFCCMMEVNQLCVYVSPPSRVSFLPLVLPSGSAQGAELGSLCSAGAPIAVCITHGGVYMSFPAFSILPAVSFPRYLHSLCLCLYPCPANSASYSDVSRAPDFKKFWRLTRERAPNLTILHRPSSSAWLPEWVKRPIQCDSPQ